MKYMLKTSVFSLFLVLGALLMAPAQADAFLLDSLFEDAPDGPHCLFMDCNDNGNNQPNTIDNSINNSYNDNTNSFNTLGTVTTQTPVYNYDNNYNQSSPLSVSCYPTPTTANVGQSIQWRSSVSGGNGNYYISWNGSEGLSGNGNTVTKSYSYGGTKNASVTVISGGQSASANCSSASIYDYNYNQPTPNYNYNYNYPNYYSLSASCSANTTYTTSGSYVSWTAYASGGNGAYSYSWSGTDSLYGSGSLASAYYTTPGTKRAWVTVYSSGQSITVQCSNFVTVSQSTHYYTPQPIVYNQGFLVACAADTTSARVGALVTWSAEASYYGSAGPFSYSWSGSEGLFGSQSSTLMRYYSPGTKTATVTVIAPNGQSQTKTCGNSVIVKSATVAKVTKPTPTPTQTVYLTPPPPPDMSATSLFSLGNVPWGWVSVLVILVLIGIILYLIYNRKKI